MAWHVLPSGNLVIAYSRDYAIKVLSPTLEVLAAFQHPGKRVEVTESDKETYLAQMTGNWDGTLRRGAPDFIRDKTEFPRYKPYFKQMHVDDEGYLLFQTYEIDGEKVVYDVFDAEGRFVNKLVMAALGPSGVLRGGFVYMVDVPDDAPATIKRYRME